MSNPYTLNPVNTPDYFVASQGGRGAQAHRLLQNIQRVNPAPNHISIIGERRFGKTSLLEYLLNATSDIPNLFIIDLDMQGLYPHNPEGFYIMLRDALIEANALSESASELNYYTFKKLLSKLANTGERLILLIDEFDLVAQVSEFNWAFFANLRYLANKSNALTLIVASVKPLTEIAHKGIYGSPFFNIFLKERLGLLSQQEAYALVSHPPGGQIGFPNHSAELIDLAGHHPYFLQLACSVAWELREAAGGTLDMSQVRASFTDKAREQYQHIWKHSSSDERNTLCAMASGTKSVGSGLSSLVERGYVVDSEAGLQDSGEGLADFVRHQLITPPPPPAAPASAVQLKPMRVNDAAPTRHLALVVGVNTYQYQKKGNYVLTSLRYAELDAVKIRELLTELKFDVKMLLGADATYKAIEQAFTEFNHATKEDPHPDSCFVFHFSGHGLMAPYNDETGYLVLHDTDPSEPAKSGIEMSKLVYNLLPQVHVPHSLTLLDSCHAGFAAGVKHGRPFNPRLDEHAKKLWAKSRGRMVLAACAGKAWAREDIRFKHGILTHYVLKHWRDLDSSDPCDGITFTSLMNYVGKQIGQNHPDLSLPTWSGAGAGPAFVLRCLT